MTAPSGMISIRAVQTALLVSRPAIGIHRRVPTLTLSWQIPAMRMNAATTLAA